MVFQQFNLWTHKTILENLIEVPVHVLGVPRAQAIDRARALMARELLAVIRGLAVEGRTMILVTHEMKFARGVASHVVCLHNGLVEEEAPPDRVFGAPRSERLKQLLKSVA